MRSVMTSAMMVLAMVAMGLVGCMESGESGLRGDPGPRGISGAPGEAGEIGPQGIQGEPGLSGEDGIDGVECAVDPDTLIMQYEWAKAEGYRADCYLENNSIYQDCRLKAKVDYESCFAATGPDVPEGTGCMSLYDGWLGLCDQEYFAAEYSCDLWYVKKVNKIPLRVCGVRIFDNSSGMLPIDEEGNYHMGVDGEADYDGDGITNWMEYLMGLNPCTAQSFGACIDDADLDYDADGVPNGEDEFPLCNPDDPGEYQSDCV